MGAGGSSVCSGVVSGADVTQQNSGDKILAVEEGIFSNLKKAEPFGTKMHISFDVDKKLSLLFKDFTALNALNNIELDVLAEQNSGILRHCHCGLFYPR